MDARKNDIKNRSAVKFVTIESDNMITKRSFLSFRSFSDRLEANEKLKKIQAIPENVANDIISPFMIVGVFFQVGILS